MKNSANVLWPATDKTHYEPNTLLYKASDGPDFLKPSLNDANSTRIRRFFAIHLGTLLLGKLLGKLTMIVCPNCPHTGSNLATRRCGRHWQPLEMIHLFKMLKTHASRLARLKQAFKQCPPSRQLNGAPISPQTNGRSFGSF